MVGQPKLLTRDQGPHLLLGGLEFAPEATVLHSEMATYLSDETQRKFNDLLTNKQDSACYRLLQQDDKAAWGVREKSGPAVSLGAIGLSAIEDEGLNRHLSAGWNQVESWLVFFDPASGGRGIASRAYQHMICMGLAMGLDVFYAPVRADNVKSRRLHERMGLSR